ncbi:hypothetical protein [uncultured Methanobrevibacter sp.]|uniref:hypothetical protein n=1 Tax=uncultured Methanobrevibacter sp. TaxID=253161 RepID=UPI0025CF25C1|nr:hypothetical protein [uncultured Methanobrevibacter sp.]
MKLNDSVIKFLKARGVAEVGFADLTDFPEFGYDSAVVFYIPAPKVMIEAIDTRDVKTRGKYYNRMNKFLIRTAKDLSKFLKENEYSSLAITHDTKWVKGDKRIKRPPLKTLATISGLGWIGRCGLLVTKKYGNALRLGAILTDATFEYGKPMVKSLCGKCMECCTICPAQTITGIAWDPSKKNIYDPDGCRKIRRDETFCSRCIYVCPHTQKYLNKLDEGLFVDTQYMLDHLKKGTPVDSADIVDSLDK